MNKAKQTNRRKKICFVALGAYPLLAKKNMGFAGGAIVQQVLLAEELVKYNFEVSFITYTDGKSHIEQIGNIKVIKVYKREDAPTLSPLFCCLTRKKFVRYISSDAEVDKKMTEYISRIGRLGNWLDIKLADAVIAQSEFQKNLLKENFGRESLIIRNAFPRSNQKISEKANPPIVLWVSTIRAIKQPELFLKLAEAIPEGRFQIIGGVGDNNLVLYNNIRENSDGISNIHFVGFVPFHEIDQYFEQASIFVNTSKYEGFPNTFIQAWMHYMPTVTLNADPDGLICKTKIGFHSKAFNQMVEDVKTLLKDEQLREEMGRDARQYVEREHDITKIINNYIKVFDRIGGF